MKNFFMQISNEKITELEEASIDFCIFTLDSSKGIIVDEENIKNALNILKMRIVTEDKTSYDGIFSVNLSTSSQADIATYFEVKIENWDGKDSNAFKKITERILLPIIKKNITISVPHGCTISPKTGDDHFYIWIWSSPEGKRYDSVPEKMWERNVACRDDGFLPSGQGISIEDKDTGWTVAEIVGDNLYIHHDICHYGKDSEKEIFSIILEKVVEELTLSEEEKEEKVKERIQKSLELSRKLYIKECSKRFQKTLQYTKEKISGGESAVKKLQKDLVRNIREVVEAYKRLNQLQLCENSELDEYGLEFDKLRTVKGVKDVLVGDGVIKIFTNTLYCTDPRTNILHEIGTFRIEIYTDGSGDAVRWFNLTRQVRGYDDRKMQAPHVFPEGKACMGNTKEIFPELIANYEFAAVAMVAIQFVESVNVHDDAGKFIDRWPKASVRKEERENA